MAVWGWAMNESVACYSHPISADFGPELPLAGRKVLVVEDDCLVAQDFAEMLREAGAEVVGPAESLPQAMRVAHGCDGLDCALLDIDLQGIAVFPLAGELRAAGIRMMFLTGLHCDSIPPEFADIPCISKPTVAGRIVEELTALLGTMPVPA
jgi:CheY-like chemotaxis protein